MEKERRASVRTCLSNDFEMVVHRSSINNISSLVQEKREGCYSNRHFDELDLDCHENTNHLLNLGHPKVVRRYSAVNEKYCEKNKEKKRKEQEKNYLDESWCLKRLRERKSVGCYGMVEGEFKASSTSFNSVLDVNRHNKKQESKSSYSEKLASMGLLLPLKKKRECGDEETQATESRPTIGITSQLKTEFSLDQNSSSASIFFNNNSREGLLEDNPCSRHKNSAKQSIVYSNFNDQMPSPSKNFFLSNEGENKKLISPHSQLQHRTSCSPNSENLKLLNPSECKTSLKMPQHASRSIRKQRRKEIVKAFGRHATGEDAFSSYHKTSWRFWKWCQKRFCCCFCFRHGYTVAFDPSGRLAYWWTMIVSFAFIYNFWVLVFRFAFDEIRKETILIWMSLDYFADLVYALDIAFHFRTGFLDDGVLQTDPSKMRIHYMNSTTFYIDMLCLLPLDFLYLSLGFKSVLRAFRLVKIYRFWEFLDRTERHTNFPNFVRTVALLHYLFAIFHWNACLVYIVQDSIANSSQNSFTSNPQSMERIVKETSSWQNVRSLKNNPSQLYQNLPLKNLDQHEKSNKSRKRRNISVLNTTKENNFMQIFSQASRLLGKTLLRENKTIKDKKTRPYSQKPPTHLQAETDINFNFSTSPHIKSHLFSQTPPLITKLIQASHSSSYATSSLLMSLDNILIDNDLDQNISEIKHNNLTATTHYSQNNDSHIFPTPSLHLKPTPPRPNQTTQDVLAVYLQSLYHSTMVLTTVGNLPEPNTKFGYAFAIFEFVFALLLFAAILGHVANIVTSISAARKEFQAKLDSVKTYMGLRRVPLRLQDRVIKWFDYLWLSKKSSDEDKTLGLLPNKLKAEIALHVHLDTLKRVEIFQNTEAGFLCELVLRLRPVLFSPGDYICRKGEVGKEMYVVNRGRLQVMADNGKTVLATLRPGSYFGEISILNVGHTGNRRTASVRSVGYSDLFCLSKIDLWEVLKDYPTARVRLEAIAVKRMEKYKKKSPLVQEDTGGLLKSRSTPGLLETSGKIPLEKMILPTKFSHHVTKPSIRLIGCSGSSTLCMSDCENEVRESGNALNSTQNKHLNTHQSANRLKQINSASQTSKADNNSYYVHSVNLLNMPVNAVNFNDPSNNMETRFSKNYLSTNPLLSPYSDHSSDPFSPSPGNFNSPVSATDLYLMNKRNILNETYRASMSQIENSNPFDKNSSGFDGEKKLNELEDSSKKKIIKEGLKPHGASPPSLDSSSTPQTSNSSNSNPVNFFFGEENPRSPFPRQEEKMQASSELPHSNSHQVYRQSSFLMPPYDLSYDHRYHHTLNVPSFSRTSVTNCQINSQSYPPPHFYPDYHNLYSPYMSFNNPYPHHRPLYPPPSPLHYKQPFFLTHNQIPPPFYPPSYHHHEPPPSQLYYPWNQQTIKSDITKANVSSNLEFSQYKPKRHNSLNISLHKSSKSHVTQRNSLSDDSSSRANFLQNLNSLTCKINSQFNVIRTESGEELNSTEKLKENKIFKSDVEEKKTNKNKDNNMKNKREKDGKAEREEIDEEGGVKWTNG